MQAHQPPPRPLGRLSPTHQAGAALDAYRGADRARCSAPASCPLCAASGLLTAESSPAARPGAGMPVLSLLPLLGLSWGGRVPPLPTGHGVLSPSGLCQDLGLWALRAGCGLGERPWGCRAATVGTEGGWLAWCCLRSSRKEGRAEPTGPLGAQRGCWALGLVSRQRASRDGSREAGRGPLSSAR